MKRTLSKTNDGSHTIYVSELDETYHSTHGAIQEAEHVFLKNGLNLLNTDEIRVFEMGFGTGLNALLTLKNTIETGRKVVYDGIEAYPVEKEIIDEINYLDKVGGEYDAHFSKMHASEWNKRVEITDDFFLEKIHAKIEDYVLETNQYDIVFYDAFGPRAQNDMWTEEVLKKMYDGLKPGGVLVTYCAQGQFKRNLKALGFSVESLPGPPGKREMTRAYK